MQKRTKVLGMGGGDLSTTTLNCVLKNGKFHVYYSMIGLPWWLRL